MNAAAKAVTYLRDGLRNVAIGLGTALDKSVSTTYAFNLLTKEQLEAAYRGDWIARKIVDAPADDATREWRTWQAEGDTIGDIEETERRLKVQQKLRWGMKLARLYGGAALIPGVKNQGDASKPLNLEKVKKDDFTSLHVVSQFDISRGPTLITDLESPWFGEPDYYVRKLINVGTMETTEIHIHPSRVIKLLGREIPDPLNAMTLSSNLWGDSILIAVDDAVKAAGVVSGGIAQLVTEAKVDIMKVEGLTENLTTDQYETRFIDRLAMTDRIKSLMHKIVIDSKEDLQRIEVNFSQLPEVLRMYLLIASGAADIPATRLLGQSAQGLNATGEADMRNYYDRVKSDQVTTLTPAIEALDEMVLRSATGDRDEDLFYEWNPLWQMTDQEKADVASKKADVMSKDVTAGLIPLEALRVGRQNQLIEDGTYPGLEQAIEDYDDEDAPAEETRQLALEQQQKLLAAPLPKEKKSFGDAEKFSAFVKVGPDQYKRKGGKGKIYNFNQVKLWYALHARGQAWDEAFEDHTPGGKRHDQKKHGRHGGETLGESGRTSKEYEPPFIRRHHHNQEPDDDFDEGTSAVILTQIDQKAFEGGGSANMKDLPGGEEIVWSMIDKGWLKRDGTFVNLTKSGKAILKKHGLKTWDADVEDFNPYHRGPGERGGQFTSAAEKGSGSGGTLGESGRTSKEYEPPFIRRHHQNEESQHPTHPLPDRKGSQAMYDLPSDGEQQLMAIERRANGSYYGAAESFDTEAPSADAMRTKLTKWKAKFAGWEHTKDHWEDFNPHHVKSGPDGGQFTSGEGSSRPNAGSSSPDEGDEVGSYKDMTLRARERHGEEMKVNGKTVLKTDVDVYEGKTKLGRLESVLGNNQTSTEQGGKVASGRGEVLRWKATPAGGKAAYHGSKAKGLDFIEKESAKNRLKEGLEIGRKLKGVTARNQRKSEKEEEERKRREARDAYNPNQPRYPKGDPRGGKWQGVGAPGPAVSAEDAENSAAVQELKRHLEMVDKFQRMNMKVDGETPNGFQLKNGRGFIPDANTFRGQRGTPKQCYANAGRAALMDPNLTYVEGHVSIYGIPIAHAWNTDSAGRLIDPTLKGDAVSRVGGYFGVPVKTKYLRDTIVEKKTWGLFDWTNGKYLEQDPKTIVKKDLSSRDALVDFDDSEMEDYDPNQPRYPKGDPRGGEWMPIGSGTSPAADLLEKNDDPDTTIEDVYRRIPDDVKEKMRQGMLEAAKLTPTQKLYVVSGTTDADRVYDADRRELQDDIIRSFLTPEAIANAMPKDGHPPNLIMLGGRPAAGKTSTMGKAFGADHFYLSADTVQERLPGYQGHLAQIYNGEAQDIALRMEAIAREKGMNILYDATLKTASSAQQRVKDYKAAGYTVEGHFVHTTPAESAFRSAERFNRTGRLVPPEVSFQSRTNEATFDSLIPEFRRWSVHDNNGATPRMVARGGTK